jgi:microcystin degradation protein MlrC
MAARERPILLLDAGDNVGGGGPGDSTIILHEARAGGLEPVLAILHDPEAVARCCEVGVGAFVELEVGGKSDNRHGGPLPVRGKVRLISDGQYSDSGPTHAGHTHYDAGKTVVIDTDQRETLVLTSLLVMPVSRQQILSLSIDPSQYRAVIAKGVVSPGPSYEPITKGSIVVATEGCTTPDLDSLEYRHRRRPLFPFEPDARYEPGSQDVDN